MAANNSMPAEGESYDLRQRSRRLARLSRQFAACVVSDSQQQ